MKELDLARLRSNLLSDDLEVKITAVDQACQLVQEIISAVMQMFEEGPERFLIAERLPRLGPTIIEPLETMVIESKESEVQVLAALVLLQLGSKTGVGKLLEAVEVGNTYELLIVRLLAANKVNELIDKIIDRLRKTETSKIDLIVGFLSALLTLKAKVPADLMQRFAQPSMPWQIRTVTEEISLSSATTS